jgi:hypothetical protein
MGLTFFGPEDFKKATINALNKYTTLNGTIEIPTTWTVVEGVPYYDLYSHIPNFFAVSEAYNTQTKQFLAFRTPVQLMQIREDYELWRGQIQFITVVDFRRVGFFPFPAAGTVEIKLKVKLSGYSATELSNTVYVPDHAADIIADLAKQELLEQAEEISKAAAMYNSVIKGMQGNKTLTNGRAFPNFAMSMLSIDLRTFATLP